MNNFTNNNSTHGSDFSGFSYTNNLNINEFQGINAGPANNGIDVDALRAYLSQNESPTISWKNCNHCSQILANDQAYAEHERVCPMRPRTNTGIDTAALQQYLQIHQENLNRQFQQHQELQAQINQTGQQEQAQSAIFADSFDSMQGSNTQNSEYCTPALPTDMTNYQGFNALQQGIEVNEAVGDTFDVLVNKLPAFDPPSNITVVNDVLSRPPESNSTEYFPLALLPEDEKWLTPLHCFVRQYCAEVFVATTADVEAPCMGKRSPVSVGQVGIRCPYCSPKNGNTNRSTGLGYDVIRARENGVVFPSIVSRIYNATINLLQRHLRTCSFVPPVVLAKYNELKASNARSGASKKYWVESAQRMGLYDTPDGIRLNKETYLQTKLNARRKNGVMEQYVASNQESHVSNEDPSAPSLVLPSDKRYTTAFTFHLMAQVQPCEFTEADRLGRRRNLEVGFAGLACRHCFGGHGNGRFFPSSIKTMSDASKTLDAIYKHIGMCTQCPNDIKQGLSNLKEFHDSEKSKMPFGNQRAFFVRIWGRLHRSDKESAATAVTAPMKSSKLPVNDICVMPNVELDSSDSLQALRAQLNRNTATMKKMINEAA